MIASREEPSAPEFRGLLEELIASGVRRIEVEYDEGEYRVTAIEGNMGLGVARYRSEEAMEPLYDSIQQLRKAKVIQASGKHYRLKITTRQEFMETTWIILVSEKNP